MTSQTLLRHGFTLHATLRMTEDDISNIGGLSWQQREKLWVAVEMTRMEDLSFQTCSEIGNILQILK